MARRVAINGFGRIGRLTFRALWVKQPPEIEVVAVNDPAGASTEAMLLEYDSNYGHFPGRIGYKRTGYLLVDDYKLRIIHERDWTKLDWTAHDVHTVLECSGRGTTREKAEIHLDHGAQLVIISAPAKGDDATIVMGVNHDDYRPGQHRIVSNASCTTNCLAPVAQVLQKTFGLKWGMLTTVHSYTNSQHIQDRAAKNPREARAAALNIIPTDTGAARALGRVIPALEGKFDGMAFRVPTSTVSAVDFVCETKKRVTVEDVNEAFVRASKVGQLRGYLGVCDRPLVSTDFRGDERSAIVDLPSTMVLDGHVVKVVAWYDNEWGYACRLADLAVHTARADAKKGRGEPQPAQPAHATNGRTRVAVPA